MLTKLKRQAKKLAVALTLGLGMTSTASAVELTMYYPVAVGGSLTKIVDGLVGDFMKENPDIKVNAIYAGNYNDARIKALAPSMVLVNFDMPYVISGVSDRHYHGSGLIVDTERGLVVVDRNTVPVSMGDVRLTFAISFQFVQGKRMKIKLCDLIALANKTKELTLSCFQCRIGHHIQ